MMENKINGGTFAGLSHCSSISSLKLLPLAHVPAHFPRQGMGWSSRLSSLDPVRSIIHPYFSISYFEKPTLLRESGLELTTNFRAQGSALLSLVLSLDQPLPLPLVPPSFIWLFPTFPPPGPHVQRREVAPKSL